MGKMVNVDHLIAKVDAQDLALGNLCDAMRTTAQMLQTLEQGGRLKPAAYREARENVLGLVEQMETLQWTGAEVKAMLVDD
jgi:hypothetical protein